MEKTIRRLHLPKGAQDPALVLVLVLLDHQDPSQGLDLIRLEADQALEVDQDQEEDQGLVLLLREEKELLLQSLKYYISRN